MLVLTGKAASRHALLLLLGRETLHFSIAMHAMHWLRCAVLGFPPSRRLPSGAASNKRNLAGHIHRRSCSILGLQTIVSAKNNRRAQPAIPYFATIDLDAGPRSHELSRHSVPTKLFLKINRVSTS